MSPKIDHDAFERFERFEFRFRFEDDAFLRFRFSFRLTGRALAWFQADNQP